MKVRWAAAGVMLAAMAIKVKTVEPEWNRAAIKECDRPCLVAALDGYMDAIFKHDPKAVPPLAIEYHMTENTGHIDVGGGVLLARACGADHVQDRGGRSGEWASGVSGRLKLNGQDNLVAIRLKVDRGKIEEIEQLCRICR